MGPWLLPPRPPIDFSIGGGYTNGMKTAVSIPDDLFKDAELLAKRTHKSRSRLFREALREYLARHAPDDVTEAMNRVCDEIGDTSDPFVSSASRRILERTEW
jgi:antitoxin MazE6